MRIAYLLLLTFAGLSLEARSPNVLVIYVDDMGWAQPGCYGGKLAPTPNLDSIVKNGVRFTDGYVSGCVCSPSRVGLLTGRYQARTGHDANSNEGKDSDTKNLLLSESTIAQRMKAAGYVTGSVDLRALEDLPTPTSTLPRLPTVPTSPHSGSRTPARPADR